MSNEALFVIEEKITVKVDEFLSAVGANDTEKAKEIAYEIVILVENNNNRCKTLKNMSCINCKKSKSIFVNNYSYVPFETQANRMSDVLVFFHYKAPTIASPLSIPKEKETCVEMFKTFVNDEHIEALFIGQSAKTSKYLSKFSISGNHVCLNCSRFVCKRKNPKDGVAEEDYESFLRHMRNSIAHGNVYGKFTCNNSYLMFDDYSEEHTLTARIVITKAQLERLKERIANIGG